MFEHDLERKKNYTRNVLGDINLFFGVPQHDLLERGGESWEEGEVWALQAEGATNTCGSRFYVEYFLSNLSIFFESFFHILTVLVIALAPTIVSKFPARGKKSVFFPVFHLTTSPLF